MRRIGCRGLAGILFLPGAMVGATEGYSDPLKPPTATADQEPSEVSIFLIPARLKEIEKEIEEESRVLAELAPLQLGIQFDEFGYHSDYVPAVDGVPDEPLWSLDLGAGAFPTQAMVLVPALDQRSSDLRGYAFPKRFRIRSIDHKGEPGKVLVDWTTRDFPDPGLRPVYFSFPEEVAPMDGLRIEVFAGHEEKDLEFFALGRVHPIRQNEQQKTSVSSVSSGFVSEPYWHQDYLGSSRQTLGMPLSAEKGTSGNLVMQLPAARLTEPLVIRIQLDEVDELGWVNVYPGQSPDGINVPGYGFPRTSRLYRVEKGTAKTGERRILLDDPGISSQPGNNMIRIPGGARSIVALEFECNDFPVYQGQAMLSLGELEIIKSGRNLSRGRRVSIRGIELEEGDELGALVDGTVSGRNILPLPEWLRQLAEGNPHEARLAVLNDERMRLSARWQLFRERALVGFGFLLLAGGVASVIWARRSKIQARLNLRRQIHADLHDDVGSSLGSVSLIAEQLRDADVNEEVREDLGDLALVAREAWASLREVVWVMDEDSVRLPVLIDKLAERARRVLVGVDVSIGFPQDCPNSVVSLTFKRHLVMFFKEVVHNCARHARATEVCLDFRIVDQQLQVSISDNGCGFDLAEGSTGLGLESIRNRAREMDGELDLHSRPGEGTRVVLRVPVKAFQNQSDHFYKTSN